MNRQGTTVILLVLFLATFVAAQQAPDKSKPETQKTQLITRVYDIRDLLEDYAGRSGTSKIVPPTRIGETKANVMAGGPGGGESNPLFGQSSPKSTAPTSLADQMLKLVTDTVAHESWRDNGGSIGAIRIIYGQMVVSQTAENQAMIADLLTQLREAQAKMVTIVARWVVLNPAQIEQLTQPIKQSEGHAVIQTIDLGALDKAAQQPVKFRAQITCYSAQTVDLSSGRAKTVITGLMPVVGQEAAAYQPESSVVQDGVNLRLTPTLSNDGSTAVVDIESVLSEWGGVQPSGFAPSTQPMNMDAPASVDRIDVQVQQFHTTIAVPIGKPVLVGGLSLPSKGKDSEGKQMYLVIEVAGSK